MVFLPKVVMFGVIGVGGVRVAVQNSIEEKTLFENWKDIRDNKLKGDMTFEHLKDQLENANKSLDREKEFADKLKNVFKEIRVWQPAIIEMMVRKLDLIQYAE